MNEDDNNKQMITRSHKQNNNDKILGKRRKLNQEKKSKKAKNDELSDSDESYVYSSSDSESSSESESEYTDDEFPELEESEEKDDTKELNIDNSAIEDKIHILLFSGLSNNNKEHKKCTKPIQKPDCNVYTEEQLEKIKNAEKELKELNTFKIPPRNKILLLDMPIASKNKIIRNMDRISNMSSYSSEYSKLTNWIDNIIKVPFGEYKKLPVKINSSKKDINNYFSKIENTLDECIYGQDIAKQKILEFVAKWVTNPNTTNEPLAFVGDKGTGKTTLAKEGIAKALNRPFFMISLGGDSDSSSFKGHDYTYEGSRWGKIVDILIQAQCMNPIIFFDELDKLSETKHGEEVAGMLMHLTDTTQNDTFTDKYFSGINFDLSKAMFIFSYNDPRRLNPILRDRLTEINFKSFNKKQKVNIAKDFLLPRAFKNIGLNKDNYLISNDVINNIISHYTPDGESGVRKLKSVLQTLLLRLNLYHLNTNIKRKYKKLKIKKKDDKYLITDEIVEKMLDDMKKKISDAVLAMYS